MVRLGSALSAIALTSLLAVVASPAVLTLAAFSTWGYSAALQFST